MKSIDVYFENELMFNMKCNKIFPDYEGKNWLVYDEDNLVGSIPMNYLIIKK